MNVYGNVRARATRKKIYDALLYLLRHKSFHEIYVKDICKIACIDRSSFYKHYRDINDLMMQTEGELSKNIAEIFGGKWEFDRECFVKMFCFIRENHEFYAAYLNGRDGSFMGQNDFLGFWKKVQNTSARLPYPKGEMFYHMAFFGAGLSAVCKIWLNTGMKQTPEEMAEIIAAEYAAKSKYFSEQA